MLDGGLATSAGFAWPFGMDWAIQETFLFFALDMLRSMSAGEIAKIAAQAREEARSMSASAGEGRPAGDGRYKVYDGVAHVNMAGMMTKRPTCMQAMFGGGVSTSRMRETLRVADQDPDVKSKLLIIDSPGGEVAGTTDLARDVARGRKPTDTFYEDLGASAALWVGTQGRQSSANDGALTGSCGVYTKQVDHSVAAEKAGARVHVVKAGKYKGIGESGTAITPEQLDSIQKRVDSMHSLFLKDVLAGRPGLTKAQLADIADAAVYVGKEAAKVGLIDKVQTLDAAHKQAVKANAERTTKKMAVTDAQLAAWLSGETSAALPDPAAAATAPAVDIAQESPLLGELAALGVKNVDDLRALAAEASQGRAGTKLMREEASRLAVAMYGSETPQARAAVSAAERFIASAPPELLQATIEQYSAQLEGAGLAAAPGTKQAKRFSAPPSTPASTTPADADATAPDTVDPSEKYVNKAYGTPESRGLKVGK